MTCHQPSSRRYTTQHRSYRRPEGNPCTQSKHAQPARATVVILVALLAGIVISACGGVASGRVTAPRASRIARWSKFTQARRPLDLAGPRRDGALVLAADGRLSLLTPGGRVVPFASSAHPYRSTGGEEPYIALSPGGAYGNGTVYALLCG
jgi:hypothetical protein